MSEATRRNQATYDKVAVEYHRINDKPHRGIDWIERFTAELPAGALIADIGSGPGRDTGQLRARGYRALCFDRSLGMLRAGAADIPAPRTQADLLALPIADAAVAGVWANACLLHLTEHELPLALTEIHRILRPEGRLHLTLKRGEGSGWTTERFDEPRWFQYWSAAELDPLLERSGLGITWSREYESTNASWLVRHCARRGAPEHRKR